MIDIAFIIIFLIFPIMIIKIMKIAGLRLFTITIPSFVIVAMFTFAYIGIISLYFGWDDYRYSIGVQDKEIILRVFYYACTSISGLVFGFIFAKKILGFKSISSINQNLRPLKKIELKIIVILILFCFIILIIYLSKLSSIAIFVALSDGISESKVARSLMGNSFAGKYHWYKLIMRDLLNLLTFTTFAAWLVEKKKIILSLFIITFLGATFSAIMATEKEPFIWLLIGMFITYILIKKRGKLEVKSSIRIFIIIMVPLLVFYTFFMGSSSLLKAIKSIFSRAFTGQIQPAYHYLEFFPKYHDFLWGRSFPNPGGLLPYKPYRYTVEVMNWKFPELASKGIVGSMPTAFWGELFVNFGSYGIIIGSFLLGLIIYIISYIISSLENTPIKIGLIVWLLLHYREISITGISAFIIDFYAVGIYFIIILAIIITNKGKIKISRKGNRY